MLNNWRVYVGSYSLLLFWRVVGFYSYGYSTPEINEPTSRNGISVNDETCLLLQRFVLAKWRPGY